jgi:hypothetical protein
MTSRCTLGPFMTLILTLTAKGNRADNVINPSRAAGVVNSLLFAQLVIEVARFKEPRTAIRVVTPVDVAPGSEGSAALDAFMAVFRLVPDFARSDPASGEAQEAG